MTHTEVITKPCLSCGVRIGISVASRPKRAGNRRRLVKALLDHLVMCSGPTPEKWLNETQPHVGVRTRAEDLRRVRKDLPKAVRELGPTRFRAMYPELMRYLP